MDELVDDFRDTVNGIRNKLSDLELPSVDDIKAKFRKYFWKQRRPRSNGAGSSSGLAASRPRSQQGTGSRPGTVADEYENETAPERKHMDGTIRDIEQYGPQVFRPVTNRLALDMIDKLNPSPPTAATGTGPASPGTGLSVAGVTAGKGATGRKEWKFEYSDYCQFVEKRSTSDNDLQFIDSSKYNSLLTNFSIPFQRFSIFEVTVEDLSGSISIGFAPKPPIYDNIVGYYTNSIGFHSTGYIFEGDVSVGTKCLPTPMTIAQQEQSGGAGGAKGVGRRGSVTNQSGIGPGDVITVIVDRRPSSFVLAKARAKREKIIGVGSVWFLKNGQLTTRDPIPSALFRLPTVGAEPPKSVIYFGRSSNPPRKGKYLRVVSPRRSEWSALPAMFPALSVSGRADVKVNFGTSPFQFTRWISKLDSERICELLLCSSIDELATFGYGNHSADLQSRIYKNPELADSILRPNNVPVSKWAFIEEEESKELVSKNSHPYSCRFVDGRTRVHCHCTIFQPNKLGACANCKHAQLWHGSTTEAAVDAVTAKMKPVDERFRALEGNSSDWRRVIICGSDGYYNVKTKSLTTEKPVDVGYRDPRPPALPAPPPPVIEITAASSTGSPVTAGSRGLQRNVTRHLTKQGSAGGSGAVLRQNTQHDATLTGSVSRQTSFGAQSQNAPLPRRSFVTSSSAATSAVAVAAATAAAQVGTGPLPFTRRSAAATSSGATSAVGAAASAAAGAVSGSGGSSSDGGSPTHHGVLHSRGSRTRPRSSMGRSSGSSRGLASATPRSVLSSQSDAEKRGEVYRILIPSLPKRRHMVKNDPIRWKLKPHSLEWKGHRIVLPRFDKLRVGGEEDLTTAHPEATTPGTEGTSSPEGTPQKRHSTISKTSSAARQGPSLASSKTLLPPLASGASVARRITKSSSGAESSSLSHRGSHV